MALLVLYVNIGPLLHQEAGNGGTSLGWVVFSNAQCLSHLRGREGGREGGRKREGEGGKKGEGGRRERGGKEGGQERVRDRLVIRQ